jgi:hypothetical protein
MEEIKPLTEEEKAEKLRDVSSINSSSLALLVDEERGGRGVWLTTSFEK